MRAWQKWRAVGFLYYPESMFLRRISGLAVKVRIIHTSVDSGVALA